MQVVEQSPAAAVPDARPPAVARRRIRVAGLVSAAACLAALATLLGCLGRLHWTLDLLSHFRVQYAGSLALAAAALALLRHPRLAAGYLALAGLNAAFVLPLYVARRPPPPPHAATHRAVLINVNTHTGEPDRVARFIREADPDLLLIEEVNRDWLTRLAPALAAYPFSLARPRRDNFGIALYSRYPLEGSGFVVSGEAGVPSVLTQVLLPEGAITLLGTHPLPPAGPDYSRLRDQQLRNLPYFIYHATAPVLLMGDLNVTPWNHNFTRLIRRSGLRDSARGFGVQPTWPVFAPLLRIPLDHVLHAPEIVVAARRVGPDVGSDHFPVIVDFARAPDRPAARSASEEPSTSAPRVAAGRQGG